MYGVTLSAMTALSRQFDRIAVLMSGLCLAHCLLVPVVLVLFPLLAISSGDDRHFHGIMLWVVLPVSVIGLALGFRGHRDLRIVFAGAGAMLALTFASTWGHDNLRTSGEAVAMVIASLLLAAAHVWNFRAVHCCAERRG